MSHYHVSQLKHLGAGPLDADLQALKTQLNAMTPDTALIGIFTGLFGLASNECLLLTQQAPFTPEPIPQGFEVVRKYHLLATVRPT